ncbi:MAG: GTP 3',8-cyclase MoaA, partial [Rudaea sp.]
LSADGKLYTCLFARCGHDLRGPLRDGASDEELATLISSRWQQRADRYSEQRAQLRAQGETRHVEMFAVGG